MWEESDVDVLPGIIEETQEKYAELDGCSFDKGFWSPGGKAALEKLLKNAALPKKGRLSKADRERGGRGIPGGEVETPGSGVGDQQPGAAGIGPGEGEEQGGV